MGKLAGGEGMPWTAQGHKQHVAGGQRRGLDVARGALAVCGAGGGERLCSGGSGKTSLHRVRPQAGRPERRLPNNAEIQETRGAGDTSGRHVTLRPRDGRHEPRR